MVPLFRPNLVNLCLAAGVLIAATACFCSSERPESNSSDVYVDDANSAQPSNSAAPAPGKKKDEGDFLVEHLEIETPRYKEIDRQVREARLLKDAAEKLNRALILPRDIVLRTKDCKEVNAFYDASDRTVTMCYELMEHFYQTFKSTGMPDDKAYGKMNDAVRFVFLH